MSKKAISGLLLMTLLIGLAPISVAKTRDFETVRKPSTKTEEAENPLKGILDLIQQADLHKTDESSQEAFNNYLMYKDEESGFEPGEMTTGGSLEGFSATEQKIIDGPPRRIRE